MDLAWYLETGRTIALLYREELGRSPAAGDEEGIVNWLYHAREHGRDAEWIREQLRESQEYKDNQNNPIPIPGPDPDPTPPPPPPPPPTSNCGNEDDPTFNRLACVHDVAQDSENWKKRANSGIHCHLFVREVARALQLHQNPTVGAWGLITKGPGEKQCNSTECGRHIHGGYGEDIIAFLPAGSNPEDEWLGFDIVVGADGPNPSPSWSGPAERRPGNVFKLITEIED